MKFRGKSSQLRSRKGAVVLARVFAASTALADQFELEEVDGEQKVVVPEYKWIHVATEGDFTGHADGEFALDRAVFASFVRNFRADPRYKAGDDGTGSAQVIPFDFEHASELPANEGSIPATGAPAPAWALELEIRDGEDGKAQLWCYAKLGTTIRNYIAKDEYRHVSIAFSLEAADPETSEDVGPRMSSIAFTNHPFLRNLTPMQIAARDNGAIPHRLGWYDSAGSPQEGIEYTRKCLGLGATADVGAVKAEIAKLAGFAKAPDTTPPGVDIDDVFSSLRSIWSLPVSATVDEIVAELDKAASQIPAAGSAPAAPATPAPAAAPAAAAPAATAQPAEQALNNPTPAAPAAPTQIASSDKSGNQEKKKMNEFMKRLIKILSARKSQINLQDEAAIELAVAEAVAESTGLSDVLTALGVKDAAMALEAIPTLRDAKVKLQEALAQLEEALSMQAEAESEMEEVDTEAAASAKGLDGEAVGVALKQHRLSLINGEVAKLAEPDRKQARKLAEARRAGRKAFLSHYGVVPKTMERLLKNLVAGPNGAQFEVTEETTTTAPRGNGERRQLSMNSGNPKAPKTPRVIDLTAHAGENVVKRLMSFIRGEQGGDKLSHDDVFGRARALKRQYEAGEVELQGVDEEVEA